LRLVRIEYHIAVLNEINKIAIFIKDRLDNYDDLDYHEYTQVL